MIKRFRICIENIEKIIQGFTFDNENEEIYNQIKKTLISNLIVKKNEE